MNSSKGRRQTVGLTFNFLLYINPLSLEIYSSKSSLSSVYNSKERLFFSNRAFRVERRVHVNFDKWIYHADIL